MHDAWTYWGHSGAPLVSAEAGPDGWKLVGVHSSWDEGSGMRRGGGVGVCEGGGFGGVDAGVGGGVI